MTDASERGGGLERDEGGKMDRTVDVGIENVRGHHRAASSSLASFAPSKTPASTVAPTPLASRMRSRSRRAEVDLSFCGCVLRT